MHLMKIPATQELLVDKLKCQLSLIPEDPKINNKEICAINTCINHFRLFFLVRGDDKMLLRHRLYDDFLILTDGENENSHLTLWLGLRNLSDIYSTLFIFKR